MDLCTRAASHNLVDVFVSRFSKRRISGVIRLTVALLILFWLFSQQELLVSHVYSGVVAPMIKQGGPYIVQPLGKMRKRGQVLVSAWCLPFLTRLISYSASRCDDDELLDTEESLASLLEQVNRTKRQVQTHRLRQFPPNPSAKQKREDAQSNRFNTLSSSSVSRGRTNRPEQTRRRRISYNRHEEQEEENSSDEKEASSDSDHPGDESPALAFIEEPEEHSQESADTIGNRLLRRRWNADEQATEEKQVESKGNSSEDSEYEAPVRRRRQVRHTTGVVR
eukprot:gb/GECG01008850.1/.p1 GENE.gb/GECG01008850.1/~~gb/GECG01008850.1/.p1  ORF type:complete len:280 (+),score=36.12 gb/GECG01008850.1/:1-840(+)